MPVYEYACQQCGHEFEEWQKMSDPPVKVCPKCHAEKVERLISRTSFQLKGGGWYGDLYASAKPGSSSGGSSSAGSSGSGSSSSSDASSSSSSSSSSGSSSPSSGSSDSSTSKAS